MTKDVTATTMSEAEKFVNDVNVSKFEVLFANGTKLELYREDFGTGTYWINYDEYGLEGCYADSNANCLKYLAEDFANPPKVFCTSLVPDAWQ